MLHCTICGKPPRQFLLLQCEDCGALSCFSCTKRVNTPSGIQLCCGACGSQHVHDTLANNWHDFPDLQQSVPWATATSGKPHIVFEAAVAQAQWAIRINDFPDEPMYTLLIDDRPVIHFDDWPAFWNPRPTFPK
jgi:hypothetical protein